MVKFVAEIGQNIYCLKRAQEQKAIACNSGLRRQYITINESRGLEHCNQLSSSTHRSKGHTMIRISLLVGIALFLYGSEAKPYSSWGKVEEDQYQETLQSGELSGKMSLGMKEVEPPEDMGVTDVDVDPSMAIWKAVQWSRGKKHVVSENDEDELNHPALDQVLEARANSAGPQEAFRNAPPVQPYQQAEPDADDSYHGFPGSEAREAEEDAGELRRRYVPDQPAPREPQAEQGQPGRVDYTQPEEDRDEVYHGHGPGQHLHPRPQVRVQPQPGPHRHVTYTQPEEDRDHLYHN
ncbi:uncharacterized protein si:ch211-217g15.3 isoform X2 [Anguilla rostrata]|uniref:uncharacterized protein si:ch211-217g15.3 isoform X2 n=1 Tax=Anguilla rostrata TaxID=7938 RepID=UPI0030D158D4